MSVDGAETKEHKADEAHSVTTERNSELNMNWWTGQDVGVGQETAHMEASELTKPSEEMDPLTQPSKEMGSLTEGLAVQTTTTQGAVGHNWINDAFHTLVTEALAVQMPAAQNVECQVFMEDMDRWTGQHFEVGKEAAHIKTNASEAKSVKEVLVAHVQARDAMEGQEVHKPAMQEATEAKGALPVRNLLPRRARVRA